MNENISAADAVEVSCSLLHLAASVVERTAPDVRRMLEEDLARRHPDKRAFWEEMLTKQGRVPLRADMISLLLAHLLAERMKAPLAVVDPDSGPCHIGWLIPGGDKNGRKVKGIPCRDVSAEVGACVSMRTLLEGDEAELAEPGLEPITLACRLIPNPVLELSFRAKLFEKRYSGCVPKITLLNEEEGVVRSTELRFRQRGGGKGRTLEVTAENLIYLVASDDAVLRVEMNKDVLSAPVPAPDGDPVCLRLHAEGGPKAAVRVSRDVFVALQAQCPWLGPSRLL